MSLYQCRDCGCLENTALGEIMDWSDPDNPVKQDLCSVCGGDGWHGKFDRSFLPHGEFVTNRDGNLKHRSTGEGPDKYRRDTPYPK